MSDTFTGGSGGGQIPLKGLKSSLGWIVFIIIAIIFLTWIALAMHDQKTKSWFTRPPLSNRLAVEKEKAAKAAQQYPQAGIITITTNEWRGITSLAGGMTAKWKILTDETFWEVRLDRDDKRVHSLYPRHWKPGSKLVISNDFNVVEWRVQSGQTMTTAEVAWSISPD